MRVWCIGAGAVGGTIASRLARNGVEPLVLDANIDHVRRLRDPGLDVSGVRTKLAAYVPDEASDELAVAPDLVLLSVRCSFTKDALQPLVERFRDDTDVLSLQNGINEDTIASIVGESRTIGCVVGIGATWIEAGHITLDAEGELTIGRLDGSDSRLEAARDVLSNAFPTSITDNIYGALWGKMLVNSMTVLGALAGCLTGELLSSPERRRLVAEVVAEGVKVGMAEGFELLPVFGAVPPEVVGDEKWPDVMDRILTRFGELYGAIRSVTLRDFELGRPTEIDAVTGEIVRRGARNGTPTPLSTRVYAMLREVEAGARKPGMDNLEVLAVGATS